MNTKFDNYRFFSVALLIMAVFVFLEAHYYHGRIQVEMPRAEVVTKITSFFWNAVAPQKTGMSASNGLVTEDTTVVIAQLVALVMALAAGGLVWTGRRNHGQSELDGPMLFLSALVGAWIISTIINTGGIYI